jgi:hypothetical protein
VTLEGKTGSKGDFFRDAEVERILMSYRIRVHVTQTGSRDVAIHDIDQYDFVFPPVSRRPTRYQRADERGPAALHQGVPAVHQPDRARHIP